MEESVNHERNIIINKEQEENVVSPIDFKAWAELLQLLRVFKLRCHCVFK